jgi:predicted transglutaminase-like cysteine proteinase
MIVLDRNPLNHTAQEFTLSGGFGAGIETADLLVKLAHEYKKNPIIRNLSVTLTSNLPSHDKMSEAITIFNFVRDNIRYVQDIKGCETIQIPIVTLPPHLSPELGIGAGDCDDHSLLLASMLLSIGFGNLYYRIVSYRETDNEWRHIYLIWKSPSADYSMDAIKKNKKFGWETPKAKYKDIRID